MARRYRKTLEGILARIVAGELVHVDDTHFNLQQGKGHVWVLTSMEEVVCLYLPNRETGFLNDLLRGFKGVLVSDFYPGYESLPYKQQACLLHLIRDMNDDLMSNPFDEEFKALGGEFGKLLRSIVDTIDRYGLKKLHLHKHKAEVARFFNGLALQRGCYQTIGSKFWQAKEFRAHSDAAWCAGWPSELSPQPPARSKLTAKPCRGPAL